MALSVRQLQRDQLAVHDDLSQARLRLARYQQLEEHELARHQQRVITGLEELWDTITTRYDSLLPDVPLTK